MGRRDYGLLTMFLTVGCAVLHRPTVGELQGNKGTLIDIKVSETGFDLEGAASISRNLTQKHGNRQARSAGNAFDTIVALTSLSPKTGNPTTSDSWADGVTAKLRDACPKGRVSNLMAVREMASYPLISGEIVRIQGECISKKN